ncbi:hypothetical protein BDZ89DRAFT_1223268 [Hymenopellis radicata]|nr:hypothetical protein BDZ89DRAFT_1223268 [Hymenopellis radicata]
MRKPRKRAAHEHLGRVSPCKWAANEQQGSEKEEEEEMEDEEMDEEEKDPRSTLREDGREEDDASTTTTTTTPPPPPPPPPSPLHHSSPRGLCTLGSPCAIARGPPTGINDAASGAVATGCGPVKDRGCNRSLSRTGCGPRLTQKVGLGNRLRLPVLPNLGAATGPNRTCRDPGLLSRSTHERLNIDLSFIDDNDEHGDIASGNTAIDDNLLDELLPGTDDDYAAEAETKRTETPADSVLHQALIKFQRWIRREIKRFGQPACYKHGYLFDRPKDPIFILARSSVHALTPDELYDRDKFVWLPHFLPGHPTHFKCTCGQDLVRRGYNTAPIARRVRRASDTDYLLFTCRYWCSTRRQPPGCEPFLVKFAGQIRQISAGPVTAYISMRGAIDKRMMWWLSLSIVKRMGPSPFSELVSETQYRHHASLEVMYYAAAANFGLYGPDQITQFSAFDDATAYAGCPPSTSYLKSLYTDYIEAHRVYMDHAQAALPLDIAKADHTFDFLKYMGGLKGEKIWKAAYNLVNQWEEVRSESLTLTKSLSFVEDMLRGVQSNVTFTNVLRSL